MPNDTSTGYHEGQKVGGGSIPGNPHPFPKELEYSSHSLACEIPTLIKTDNSIFRTIETIQLILGFELRLGLD